MLYKKIEERMKRTLEMNPEYQKLNETEKEKAVSDQMEDFSDFLFGAYVQQQNNEHSHSDCGSCENDSEGCDSENCCGNNCKG